MTITRRYASSRAMSRGIKSMAKQGWSVRSTSVDNQGYGCGKTLFYGCLFLPLALLGKKRNAYIVTFEQ